MGKHLKKIEFRMADRLPADDRTAQFVTSVSMGWNDLRRANERLLAGLTGGAEPHQNLYDANQVARHIVEITNMLRESRDDPAVRKLIKQLPEQERKDLHYCLRVTRPKAGKFRTRLVAARHMASHYPSLGQGTTQRASLGRLKRALENLAEHETELVLGGGTYKEIHAAYADEVAAQLFCLKASGVTYAELSRHILQLRRVSEGLIRVCTAIILLYFL